MGMFRSRIGATAVIAGSLVGGSLLGAGPNAGAVSVSSTVSAAVSAAPTSCVAPVQSTTQRGYTIADPHCDFDAAATPFVPLTAGGQDISTVYAGIADGSAYRIEVPKKKWNHELVLFAHGFRGNGTTVWVDSPTLRDFYIQQGFAWAASSYETNGYDVGHGVSDTHALIALFGSVVGQTPKDLYMSGLSMGGQITAVEIEHGVWRWPSCGSKSGVSCRSWAPASTIPASRSR